jgi:hypothetical protein
MSGEVQRNAPPPRVRLSLEVDHPRMEPPGTATRHSATIACRSPGEAEFISPDRNDGWPYKVEKKKRKRKTSGRDHVLGSLGRTQPARLIQGPTRTERVIRLNPRVH